MHPPIASPSLPHSGQAFPLVGSSLPTARPSFPHAMPMQLPIELGFPMGEMGRQPQAPNTSSVNTPQDDYGYQSRFDADYQGAFGSK
ncbi:hypothetical protein SLEP1_g17533 [Rubroshorea leprosula]|uniref:Uncharacterized protein n=1 Tax=Rubroshorea leprosula TaxID=152421 RepID=A0AAV5J561_9ROSI|nr:hypothetical protein SLEP1_g17533 [Rubroshorea leprosula]